MTGEPCRWASGHAGGRRSGLQPSYEHCSGKLDFSHRINLNTIMDSSSPNWGGSRRGAGRKPSANVRVSLRIPRDVWALLEAEAARLSTAPEELAVRWLASQLHESLFAR